MCVCVLDVREWGRGDEREGKSEGERERDIRK